MDRLSLKMGLFLKRSTIKGNKEEIFFVQESKQEVITVVGLVYNGKTMYQMKPVH